MIELLHGFFNFLGETRGELFKTAIELVLFTIVDYMIISEYTRNRKRELKFLIIAFSVMVLQKVLSVYFLASTVFIQGEEYIGTVNNIGNFFEIFALFLVANAFVYPIIKQKRLDTTAFIKNKFAVILPITFILSVFVLSIIDLKGGSLEELWTGAAISVGEIVVLLYYASYLLVNAKYPLKYRANIVLSFILYSVTPTIELFNMILYDGSNRSLAVASHPFPFISVLIITQVIYLKLVDKATILDRLRESEKRYMHEKELSNLKDEFISTVSHELRTPLTSMKLYISLLKGKLGKVSKKQRDALDILDSESNRLNKLITDILDLNRFEANKMRLDLSTFDLYSVVSNEMYLNMAKDKGIDVVLDVEKGFMVKADHDRFQQVFINLFNNSLKFTPEHGTITVSAQMSQSDWSFSLSDTGKGVPKEHIPKLFNKFYQAENFMTRTQGGIGLGLAIVKSIVDLHKGKISVESEVGKGTKISIKIPRELEY